MQFHSLGEDYVHSPAKELGGGAIWPEVSVNPSALTLLCKYAVEKVKCNLNYKDTCPGIIYKKDFADFLKKYKCRAPKKRREVGTTGVCTTCANAERSGVWNARQNAGKRSSECSLVATVLLKLLFQTTWSFKKKVVRLRTFGTGFHRSGTA